jgi:hypothetical protein
MKVRRTLAGWGVLATDVVNDKGGVGQTKRKPQAATPVHIRVIPVVEPIAEHEPPASLS